MNFFSEVEKYDCYTLTAGVMTCGGIEFKTKGRDDQAECENVGPDRCKSFHDENVIKSKFKPLYCSATLARRQAASKSTPSR